MAHYHSYNTTGMVKLDIGTKMFTSLVDDMDALRTAGSKAGIVDASFTEIGKSLGKLAVPALKIGKNPANKVLLVGCHHAREWISVEVPFLIGKYLVDNYTASPASPKEKRIKYLVDNAEICIVPMANPDGHRNNLAKGITGGSSWRTTCVKNVYTTDEMFDRYVETSPYKTEVFGGDTYKYYRLTKPGTGKKITITIKAGTYEGTDMNRNYPVSAAAPAGSKVSGWGVETHDEPGGYVEISDSTGVLTGTDWYLSTSKEPSPPTTFCGKSAGSEPETTNMVKLLQAEKFKCVIDYHSYSQLILYPDDVDTLSDLKVHFLGRGMEQLFKSKSAAYTYQAGAALYPTSGDSISFSYRDAKTPHYCIELTPTEKDGESSPVGKGWAFNRLPESEIDRVFAENLPAALAAINCAINGFSTAKLSGATPAKTKQAIMNSWKVFWSWKP